MSTSLLSALFVFLPREYPNPHNIDKYYDYAKIPKKDLLDQFLLNYIVAIQGDEKRQGIQQINKNKLHYLAVSIIALLITLLIMGILIIMVLRPNVFGSKKNESSNLPEMPEKVEEQLKEIQEEYESKIKEWNGKNQKNYNRWRKLSKSA